jgi:NADPH:quinone reductase-like Zn-dependent oxidoreductase
VKAVQFSRFGGPEVLEIVELAEPHPGVGEIRIRVRAAGINAGDWRKRQGLMDQDLPQTLGHEASGVVDEVGADVDGVAVGDRVFGASPYGAAQAELAVLSHWAPIPATLDEATSAAIPAATETAARALDELGVTAGSTVLINGASGRVGTAAVQLARERGARVIGTGSASTHELLRCLGAEPVGYGAGMTDRIRAIAPAGVDVALDVAGSGVLAELVRLAGDADHVLTVADVVGAQQTGVRFSRGDTGRAMYALDQAARMASTGRFFVRVGRTFPLAEVAEAHRVGEAGTIRGTLVLLVD